MNVTKDIDIKMLKDMLGNMIERCQTSLKPKVELDYNTAIRIYDVLEETQIREERHQTLESACTFMEMEDGTQTNELEYQLALEKMLGKLGHVMRNECYECSKAYENITKAFEENKEKNKDIEEDDDFV